MFWLGDWGKRGYLAPEYVVRGQLTEKADVFSFGVVVLELVSGRSNFDHRLPTDTPYLLDWVIFFSPQFLDWLFFFYKFCIDNSGDSLNPNHQGNLLPSQSMRRRVSSWDLNSQLPALRPLPLATRVAECPPTWFFIRMKTTLTNVFKIDPLLELKWP
jgi:serine/threonine protein kinase